MKYTFILFTLLFISSCKNKAEKQNTATDLSTNAIQPYIKIDPATATTIKFEQTEYDFGTIAPDKKVQHYYVFTNTGKKPVNNLKVEVVCGCTTPYIPEKPILPGKKDSILLEFNPSGQMPQFAKQATVTANIDKPILLRFKGQIADK